MREIKFRAWCEGKHEDISFTKPFMDYEVGVSSNGNYYSVISGIDSDITTECDTIPVMQYVGLKDVNGKDIYEGDIYKSIHTGNIEVVRYKNSFVDSMEYEDDVIMIGFAFIEPNSDELEVIGNIYENPELLNQ